MDLYSAASACMIVLGLGTIFLGLFRAYEWASGKNQQGSFASILMIVVAGGGMLAFSTMWGYAKELSDDNGATNLTRVNWGNNHADVASEQQEPAPPPPTSIDAPEF